MGVGVVFAAGIWAVGRGGETREGLPGAIDAIVDSAMQARPTAGVSLAVARGGRVIYEQGYGFADLENRIPATASTVYRVGSITKQFTAAAVMRLVDEGRIRLDAPVTEYIPDYPTRGNAVTVASLLNHTSGIRNFTTMQRWWETMALEMPPARLMTVFRDEPFDFPSGTRFSYTNSGYTLLGIIIERVTGRPYGSWLHEFLFAPLELPHTSYCDDDLLVPNRARGYKYDGDHFINAAYVSMSQAYAAGAVCSSALDLIRWSHALASGSVVSRDAYRQMSTAGTLSDGTQVEYGYGLAVSFLEGHRRVNHVGGTLGFSGQYSHYTDDDVTIVVLSNTEGFNAAHVEAEIARLILGVRDAEVKDLLLAPAELRAYVGEYDLGIARVTVSAENGRLVADAPVRGEEARYRLLYQGEQRFQAEDDPQVSVTFTLADGVAVEFVLVRYGITMRGRRVAAPASR